MQGVYRVEIRGQRKTGRKIPAGPPTPPGTMVEEVVEVIPEKYNKVSKLRFEVKGSADSANFELLCK